MKIYDERRVLQINCLTLPWQFRNYPVTMEKRSEGGNKKWFINFTQKPHRRIESGKFVYMTSDAGRPTPEEWKAVFSSEDQLRQHYYNALNEFLERYDAENPQMYTISFIHTYIQLCVYILTGPIYQIQRKKECTRNQVPNDGEQIDPKSSSIN